MTRSFPSIENWLGEDTVTERFIRMIAGLIYTCCGGYGQVLVEEKGVGRFVTLNRPRVLNCLNLDMVNWLEHMCPEMGLGFTFALCILSGSIWQSHNC